MAAPELDYLAESCKGRLEARLLAAEEAEPVVVAGAERLLVVVSDSGQGVAFSWTTTTWLVDVPACTALGLVEEGGEGSLGTSVSLTACPGNADQRFLLERAGYVAPDPMRLELDSILPKHGGPTRDEAVGDLGLHAEGTPPFEWHDGTPPASFPANWVANADGPCPSYSVHHADRLRHSVATIHGGRLHTYWDPRISSRNGRPESHGIFEDTRRRRWSVVPTREVGAQAIGDSVDGGRPTPAPPSLGRWTWSQEPAFMDAGFPSIAACTPSGFACARFDLRLASGWPDHVRWSSDGLLVYASEDDSTPILLRTDLLLSILGELAPLGP